MAVPHAIRSLGPGSWRMLTQRPVNPLPFRFIDGGTGVAKNVTMSSHRFECLILRKGLIMHYFYVFCLGGMLLHEGGSGLIHFIVRAFRI